MADARALADVGEEVGKLLRGYDNAPPSEEKAREYRKARVEFLRRLHSDWPDGVGCSQCDGCMTYECGGVNKPYSWKQCRLRGKG